MDAQQNFSRRAKMLGLGALFGLGLLTVAAPAEARPPRWAPAHGYRRKVAVSRYRTAPRVYRTRTVWRNGRRVVVPYYRSRVGGYRTTIRRRDIDGDGIRNSRDRDVDGDGIRNRRDRDDDNDGIRDRRDRARRRIGVRRR